MWGKRKKFVLIMLRNPYKYVIFTYLMRRIGSAEVTGPIPVSSSLQKKTEFRIS